MKRHTHLRSLSSDHHQALVLVRKITQGLSDPGNLSALMEHVRETYHTRLLPHFQLEEQYLLPALEQVGEGALVRRTLDEHKVMGDLVAALASPAQLAEFASLLKQHVAFEEQTLFNVSQDVLDDATLETIGAACS